MFHLGSSREFIIFILCFYVFAFLVFVVLQVFHFVWQPPCTSTVLCSCRWHRREPPFPQNDEHMCVGVPLRASRNVGTLDSYIVKGQILLAYIFKRSVWVKTNLSSMMKTRVPLGAPIFNHTATRFSRPNRDIEENSPPGGNSHPLPQFSTLEGGISPPPLLNQSL